MYFEFNLARFHPRTYIEHISKQREFSFYCLLRADTLPSHGYSLAAGGCPKNLFPLLKTLTNKVLHFWVRIFVKTKTIKKNSIIKQLKKLEK